MLLTVSWLMGCGEADSPQTDSELKSLPKSVSIRVMTYNIHHARGLDGKVDTDRIAEVILRERADIVGLQEVDRGVARTDRRDLIAELAQKTGMQYYFERNVMYQGGDYGNGILSRYPILERTNTHYRMIRAKEQRGVMKVALDIEGRRVMFMNTHIDYRPDNEERLMNVEEIKGLIKGFGGVPVILCGDFNDYPGGRVHEELKTVLVDTWEAVGQGDGFTYPSGEPRSRIDYVWMTPGQGVKPVKAWVPRTEASDHLPLVVEFELQ